MEMSDQMGREATQELVFQMAENITPETTDVELESLAIEYENAARQRGYNLHECLRECLREHRDDLRRVAIATADFQ